MTRGLRGKLLPGAGVMIVVIGLDQWSKAMIEDRLGPGSEVHAHPLAGDWFSLAYSQNTGAAFGLFRQHPGAVTVLSILILLGLGYWMLQRAEVTRLLVIGLGLIGGGAVGNLLDRTRLGYVTDFISVGVWPTFNLADSAIVLGVGLLIWGTMKPEPHSVLNRESVGPDD